MNHLQSGFDEGNTDILITRDGDQVKMADNGSGFEVEVAPAAEHHDWLSETGLTEETPLFSGSDKRSESNRGAVPKDKLRRVWLVFYMLGMTTLLPWNFFIAVNDYWNFKFRDTEHNATHTELQKEFTSYLGRVRKANLNCTFIFSAISSNIPNAVFVILNVIYGQRFRLNVRLIGSLSLMATLFIAVLIMTRMDSDTWQSTFLLATLLIVVLLNICTAIFQGGLIGVAGKFPSNYMGGMMAGQALGGIFPALVNIAVIALDVNAPEIGFFCFLIAFLFVLLSLVMFMVIQTTTFFRHFAGTGDIAYRAGRTYVSLGNIAFIALIFAYRFYNSKPCVTG